MFLAVMQTISDGEKTTSDVVERIIACYEIVETLRKAENTSDFQLEKLLEALK